MIRHNIVFTPATGAILAAEGYDEESDKGSQELPAGLWPAAGDLWADDRVSEHIFQVRNRLFHWDANGDLTCQLLLEIAPGDSRPSTLAHGGGAEILPFVR